MFKKITFIFVALIYVSSLSNTIFGGDSGDLVSAIITKGFPHPPGYPLYTLIGIFFNRLPLLLTSAGKVTLISTVSIFLALIILWQIIKEIASPKYFNYFLLIAVIFTVAFNYIVWLYTIVPEVFPLNVLITLSIFYSAIKWYKTLKNKYLFLIAFLVGLGITHHHTFILVIPSLVYLFFKKKGAFSFRLRELLGTSVCLFTGLLPLTYLFWAYQNKSEIIWGRLDTFSGAVDFLLRRGYGTFIPGPFITNVPQHRLLQLKNLFVFTSNDYTLWGIIFFILGVIFLLRLKQSDNKTLLWAILINVLFFGPIFFFYANFPLTDELLFATLERFLLIYYFFFAVFVYFGMFFTFTFVNKHIINRFTDKVFLKKLTCFLILLIFFIFPARLFLENKPVIYALKNDQTAENLAKDVLQNVPPNSLVLLGGDTILFNSQYIYHTDPQIRKKIILLHPFKFYSDANYHQVIKKHYPRLRLNTQKINFDIGQDLIKPNKDTFAVYSDAKYRLTGLDEYAWAPQGLLYKLVEVKDIKNPVYLNKLGSFWQQSFYRQLSKEVKNNDPKFKHFFTYVVINEYLLAHQNSAFYYLALNQSFDKALAHINEAISLNPQSAYNYLLFSVYYRKTEKCQESEKAILKAISLLKKIDKDYLQHLQIIGEQCYKDKNNKERVNKKIRQLEKSFSQTINQF